MSESGYQLFSVVYFSSSAPSPQKSWEIGHPIAGGPPAKLPCVRSSIRHHGDGLRQVRRHQLPAAVLHELRGVDLAALGGMKPHAFRYAPGVSHQKGPLKKALLPRKMAKLHQTHVERSRPCSPEKGEPKGGCLNTLGGAGPLFNDTPHPLVKVTLQKDGFEEKR